MPHAVATRAQRASRLNWWLLSFFLTWTFPGKLAIDLYSQLAITSRADPLVVTQKETQNLRFAIEKDQRDSTNSTSEPRASISSPRNNSNIAIAGRQLAEALAGNFRIENLRKE